MDGTVIQCADKFQQHSKSTSAPSGPNPHGGFSLDNLVPFPGSSPTAYSFGVSVMARSNPDPAPDALVPESRFLLDHRGQFHVNRLFEELNVRPADVARALGVKPQQVHAWLRSRPVLPKSASARALLGEMARIVEVLRALIPDNTPEHRQLWLQNPNAALRFERPIDLILNDRGGEVFDVLYGLYTGDVSL